ncbi:MAG: protein kinase [Gemmatimonadota bacterium]|nr:protein kinase [Gemmatimonadota bacterium]
MAKKLKEGDVLNGYRITKVFGPGAMAISYAAESPAGERVFFKQYKSPSVTVEWYRPFVKYQKEMHRRITESPARNYCVRTVDAFEAVWGGRSYYQAFELIETGHDMGEYFENERAENGGRPLSAPFNPRLWERHVIWAKVFMSGINALHQIQIAHSDLKPDNAFLIEDPSISAGYQLKLIDMDFSVLTDQTAPWHGHQGYVGTDNYRSPEHFTPGATPGLASDVFTCGLILYELLAGRHPYWSDDQAQYAEKVRAYSAPVPELGGTMPAPADNAEVAAILHRCLNPDPTARPTAVEVRDVLTGRSRGAAAISAPVATGVTEPVGDDVTAPFPDAAALEAPVSEPIAPEPIAAAAGGAGGAALTSARIQLAGESGVMLNLGVRTPLGKHICRQFGPDSSFWDTEQCVLERGPEGAWQVVPRPGTTNETLLNGEPIDGPRPLHDGDTIAVGRAAKGISKLPLTVRAA